MEAELTRGNLGHSVANGLERGGAEPRENERAWG